VSLVFSRSATSSALGVTVTAIICVSERIDSRRLSARLMLARTDRPILPREILNRSVPEVGAPRRRLTSKQRPLAIYVTQPSKLPPRRRSPLGEEQADKYRTARPNIDVGLVAVAPKRHLFAWQLG
jgi:hypothetical protein